MKINKFLGLCGILPLASSVAIPLSSCTNGEFTVTFQSDGTVFKTLKVAKNSTIYEPKSPEKANFVFGGWYTDLEFKNKFDFNTKITSNLTLHAQWLNEQIQITPFTSGTYIVGDASYETAYFSINKNKGDAQTFEVSITSDLFAIEYIDTYTNNVICVKISRKNEVNSRITENLDITFKCKNSDGSIAWTQAVEAYKFVYEPLYTIDDTQKEQLTDYDETHSKAYKTYSVDVAQFVNNTTYNVEIIKTGGSANCYATFNKVVVDKQNKKLNITLDIEGTTTNVDYVEFNMKISTLDTTGYTVVSPTTIHSMKLRYFENEQYIPDTDLDWDTSAETHILKGFKNGANITGNVLYLPSKHSDHNYTIANGAFYDQAHSKTKIPDTIGCLKFEDISTLKLDSADNNTFKDAPFTVLNLKEQQFNKSFEDLNLGTNSFDFRYVMQLPFGKVLFKNDGTEQSVNKNVLQKKLYDAGLKNPFWYDTINVTNEEELRSAIGVGGHICLNCDGSKFNIKKRVEFSSVFGWLDLNGKELVCEENNWTYSSGVSSSNPDSMVKLTNSQVIIFDTSEETVSGGSGVIKPFNQDATTCSSTPLYTFEVDGENSKLTLCGGKYYANKSILKNTNGGKLLAKSIYYTEESVEKEYYIPHFYQYLILDSSKKAIYDATVMFDKTIKHPTISFEGGCFHAISDETQSGVGNSNFYTPGIYGQIDSTNFTAIGVGQSSKASYYQKIVKK